MAGGDEDLEKDRNVVWYTTHRTRPPYFAMIIHLYDAFGVRMMMIDGDDEEENELTFCWSTMAAV